MGTLIEGLKKLRKSALTGLAASVAITLLWFIFLSSKSVRTLGLAILGAAVILFFLKFVYDFVIEKLGVTKKFLANELFILFALIAFLAVTICAFAPVMLFADVHNEKAELKVAAYVASERIEDLVITEDGGAALTVRAHNINVEQLCLETQNGALYGWLLRGGEEHAPTVLYFGGNGEDSAERILDLIKRIESEQTFPTFDGYNFAYIDYPGYGLSEGAPSEKSLKRMGLDAYDYLISRSDVSTITLMGYGLGTGVANYVASERQPAELILLAPYADGYDLYNNYANIFHGPLKALVSFKMKAVKFAEKVHVKPLILASKADKEVPYESSARLFEKYEKGCNFVTVDEVEHNDFWNRPEVLDEIEKYLKQ